MAWDLRSRLRSRGTQLAIAAVVVIAVLVTLGVTRKKTQQFFTAKVSRGDITSIVQATGTVNAVTTVQVGSQVSGRIDKIFVDFNSQVKRGKLIAEIEPTVYKGQVLQAQADLENAQANVTALEAAINVAQQDVAASKANVEKAQASLDQARLDRDRMLPLFKQGIISAQQRDQVVTTYSSAVASLDGAQAAYQQSVAKLKSAQAQLLQARAQVAQKKAALDVAQTNLDHCEIYSPIDGTVVNRAVDVGQTVAASFQTPTLFTIAQDLSKMQVYAKTDESDVGRLRVGEAATFTVDAFPNETFQGSVSQIRMNATTVQNVVEYDTIINFDNPGNRLFPGMTAYVNIPVASVHQATLVPNAALRFKPDYTPDQLRAVLARYGMGPRSTGTPGANPTGQSASSGGPQAAQAGGWQGRRGNGGGNGGNGGWANGQRPGAHGAGQQAGVTLRAATALVWKVGPNKEPCRYVFARASPISPTRR